MTKKIAPKVKKQAGEAEDKYLTKLLKAMGQGDKLSIPKGYKVKD